MMGRLTFSQHPKILTCRFVSGHPRNDLMLEKSFLAVERLAEEDGSWELVATDADWETQ